MPLPARLAPGPRRSARRTRALIGEAIINDSALRVSVVDDDAQILRALRRLLQATGFSVDTFLSAEEFLARGRTDPPDCLVLDIHMGGLSGTDLDERLTKTQPPIPTVFITAHDDPQTRERVTGAGRGYLHKPFEDEALIAAIHTAVARGSRR